MLMCRYHYLDRPYVHFLFGEADGLPHFFLHSEQMLHLCTFLCLAPELRPNSDMALCDKKGRLRIFGS